MSDTDDIDRRLHGVLKEILDEPNLEVYPGLRMGDIESWDSFAHINLMLAIESEFDVEFGSDEIGDLRSVRDLSAALRRHLAS